MTIVEGELSMDSAQITQLLQSASEGDKEASERLIRVVYGDLHRLASRYLSGEKEGHILQTTALVNETYFRLFGGEPLKLNNRAHFFAVAATQMRRILVDDARSRRANKRNGIQIELDEAFHVTAGKDAEVVALDDALNQLAELYPENAKVVELRFFGGYTNEETAEIVGENVAKVRRDWEFARAWLYDKLANN
jgi:RNA polymerase sigma factor (TIGR02999 family)